MSPVDPLAGVSRETISRLETLLSVLAKWNPRINLVGPATLAQAWQRHILDSAQIFPLLPGEPGLVDLGSGAGFPGLVLAILGAEPVHLIESDQRKCAFLAEAARATGTRIVLHNTRIEAAPPIEAAAVTARALKPLAQLLELGHRFHRPGAACYFHKGASWEQELREAQGKWRFRAVAHPSVVDPAGVVLELREIERGG